MRRAAGRGTGAAAWPGAPVLAFALALFLPACGRGERGEIPESAPRLDAVAGRDLAQRDSAPAAPPASPAAPTVSGQALQADSAWSGRCGSAPEASDTQPQDAYYSLARSLDSAERGDMDFAEEKSDPAAVLTLGDFHGDEVADADSTHDWMGLYRDPAGSYRWGSTRVRIEPRRDEIVDHGTSRITGKFVSATVPRDYVLLTDWSDPLPEGPVTVLDSLPGRIEPGARLAFRFQGAEYRLAAVRPPRCSPDGFFDSAPGYRLFLTSIREGVETTRMILRVGSLDDKVPGVSFAGDLDGDGWLDLILDDAGHYNVSATSLYLSRPARPESLLKRVGSRRTTGC